MTDYSELLRLDADDPEVRERTDQAIAASENVKPLWIRCAECGGKLAAIGDTEFGPIFASTWDVEQKDPHVVVVNGKRLEPREQSRYMDDEYSIEHRSGSDLNFIEKHGTIALLALPQELVQDFPDFLVRCLKHGDLVLDRIEVIQWLRRGRAPKVRLAFPHLDYRPLEAWGEGETSTSSVTRRIKL